VYTGQEAGKPPRTYAQDIDGGKPRPITPPGITGERISPDGTLLYGADAIGKPVLVSLKTGDLQEVRGFEPHEYMVRWSADSRWFFVYQAWQLPITIHRVDPRTGHRELIRTIMPPDSAGIVGRPWLYLSADGNSYVYAFQRHLSELFLARGLGD
jgi:hypothetical protein